MNDELCSFLTQPHIEEQFDAEREAWLQELGSIESEFELGDDAPGMLEAYPEIWARIHELVGCDAEEETLA